MERGDLRQGSGSHQGPSAAHQTFHTVWKHSLLLLYNRKGASGTCWVEASDVANPTIPGDVHATKNDGAQNVTRGELEKPCEQAKATQYLQHRTFHLKN